MISPLLPQSLAIAWLALAVVLEVAGSCLLKLSDGLRHRLYGLLGIVLVIGAFAALAQAIRGMDLSVAYAVWGGAGLVITAIVGALAFGQRIRPSGWAGIGLVIAGVVALKMV
ncbi:multidrug/spermidine efflux SMR transporter subunit MdtI [Bosea sp. (in: a-proteobacteria)]|jgi:spermidine export protein MdtI|uniref:multidrug/spermidine efflux SMR transporter subunit MdtI n=1 Tax=Bosea sp. (in: a-proteobacteria) TaxID=1871050 RepID=UPI0027347869|nr:multidrug/spermidine efflux SMR transporter subunit MdtI [Bosea sp. (in: a-proteobacteria)]MDP3409216.1 multidrug/spermidine efflux SMR transporter subunit MdtI [Bosea sp. (in: a-proteobacteria)]